MKIQNEVGQTVDASRIVLRAGCFDGEVIVVALERCFTETRRTHPGKVLYAWPELPVVRDLREKDLRGLRVVHELKREFDGWIDPRGYEKTSQGEKSQHKSS